VIPTLAEPVHWWLFLGLVAVMMALDLAVLNRGSKVIGARAAARNTLVFVACAAGFAVWLGLRFGRTPALEFTTGYLIEYALSVDNLFVFLVLFSYFNVPDRYQPRVLFWGSLGAVVLRGAFILAGSALLARFAWAMLLFGAFLVWTGIKLLFAKDEVVDPETNSVLRLCRRFLRLTPTYHEQRFFVRLDGRLFATPLFLVLVVVDVIDVVFAVDSIPAIFAVTRDPFLVLSSNVFAVLGLRSLYFLLASLMGRFHYLRYGLGLILAFVGVKMLVVEFWHVPIGLSLGVVIALLAGSVAASWLFPPAAPPANAQEREK
jgi:tellurite resistance protein TerC